MTVAVDLDKERGRRPVPLRIVDAGSLAHKPVPERDWLVPNILLRRSITLFGGDGGTGKSLACLQLQVAAALGMPWLGIPLPDDGLPSFGMYCEDDEDEIHRRLGDCLRHYGASYDDVASRLFFASRVGEANELMVFGYKSDAGTRTPLFSQLESFIALHGIQLVVIDTVADTFLGNENIRPQVKTYVNAMRRLALVHNGGVILTSHPSRSGMADGSGQSGSTGWHGSVRARIYLSRPRRVEANGDGEAGPTDERLLRGMKNNYGPDGEVYRLRWQDGVFVRTDMGAASSIFDRLDDDRRVLDAAEYLVGNGSLLACDPQTRTSLVTLARTLEGCREIPFSRARAAQDRLLEQGRLVRVEMGPPSRRRVYIRPAGARYPGEDVGV